MAGGSGGLSDKVTDNLANLLGSSDITLTDLRDLLNSLEVGQTNKVGAPAHGQDTDDGTGSQVNGGTSIPVPDNFGVRVKALSNNTDPVYIGGSGVTSADGFQLTANSGVVMYVGDVNEIYFYAATSGDGVSWIVEQAS